MDSPFSDPRMQKIRGRRDLMSYGRDRSFKPDLQSQAEARIENQLNSLTVAVYDLTLIMKALCKHFGLDYEQLSK